MLWNNIKASYAHIPYTWKHKIAVIRLEKQLTGKNTLRCIFHDTDKLMSYILLPFLTLRQHKELHKKLSAHHHYEKIDKLPEKVLMEIVLDWESARYTKPDKPETAREYCLRAKPWCYPYLRPLLDKFGI